MKMQSFDGFHIGQQLSVPEIDQNSRYLVEMIIPGGMGVCIKLVNLDTHKSIALKGIQKELLSDRDAVERFKKELNIWYVCASLDGVVDTLGIVMINNIPYMASEWCVGGDLSSHLVNMTAAEKISTFLSIVDALKAVHDKFGVIHRDLKPQNVLVGEKLRPLISDWGLAKIYADHSDCTVNAGMAGLGGTTAAGMGTLLYMSPEQLRRDPSIDFRSDIYALGCILHELETGEPPYLGRTPREVANRHLSEPPPKLGGLFRKTNLGLEKVITKCLQKDPKDRYQSYGEFLQALSEYAKKRGVSDYQHTKVRYERVLPGVGYDQYIRRELSSVSKGQVAVLSKEKYMAVREEAGMLIQTGRYAEAIKLLRPLINVENIGGHGFEWHEGASAMEDYAHALMLNGELEEADRCYQTLDRFSNKPSVFYVNRAYLYLHKKDSEKMLDVCKKGLQYFPNDKDILGNAATAFRFLDDYEAAVSMLKRSMALGADVYDYESLNNTLKHQTEELRYTNLDCFSKNMRNRYSAISNGLALNPRFLSLILSRAEYIAEVNEYDGISYVESLLAHKEIQGDAREFLLRIWVDSHVERAWFGSREKVVSSIEAIGKHLNEDVSTRCRQHIVDSYYMLHLRFNSSLVNDLNGNGRFLVDWALAKDGGDYCKPAEAARVLVRLNQKEEALRVIGRMSSRRSWRTNQTAVTLLLELSEYSRAVEVAQKGVEIMPEHREAWAALFAAYQHAGRTRDAENAQKAGMTLWTKEQAILADLRRLYIK